ncbi:MAG: winged helix-turn-helix domain-containing protein [Terriglobales bacterium]
MGPGGAVSGSSVRFGDDFELDLRAYELRRSDQSLKLPRIPMELLLLLLEQRGQLVTREQIVERIWGKDVFLDTDNSINAAIRKIRQVLDDDPEQPRFIQTVTGKGYRFIAPIQTTGVAPAPAAADERTPLASEPVFGDSVPAGEKSRTGLWALGLGIAIVLAAAAGAYLQWSRPRVRSQAAGGRIMLAVLPFENLTGDAGQEYFSDGLTEEMITQLGSLDPQHLGVIARTSVMHYKNSQERLDRISAELGVQYVLEGSVRRDSDHVRITAQLIQVKDQTHVWAREYDRELKNLLMVQGEIAQEILDEIQVSLGNQRKGNAANRPVAHTPASYEAYDFYLKGRYFWNKRTPDGFRQAAEYFQQAIAKDPNYARAYAGLADTFGLMSSWSLVSQNEFMPKARAAALKALELDESLAEAHTSLALIAENYDYDWQTAGKEFQRAIQLDPDYPTAHQWYAECLAWQGRFDEALAESERAQRLDPLSLIIASDNGVMLYYARQYDRAIEKFRSIREMDPTFRPGLLWEVYARRGGFADALAGIEEERRLSGEGPWIWMERAYVYGRTGQQVQARHEVAKLEEWNRRRPVDPAMFVEAYIGMGNKEEAFVWLEKAYAQHSGYLTHLKVDPLYDPLRSDPRFQDLLRRVGLAQ